MQKVNKIISCIVAMSLMLSLSACSFSVSFGDKEESEDTLSAETVVTTGVKTEDSTESKASVDEHEDKEQEVEDKLDTVLSDLDDYLEGIDGLLKDTDDWLSNFGDDLENSQVDTTEYTAMSGAILTDARIISNYENICKYLTDANLVDVNWVQHGEVVDGFEGALDDLMLNFMAGLYCVTAVPSEYRDIEINKVLEKQGIPKATKRLVVCSSYFEDLNDSRMYLSAWAEWFSQKVGMDIVYLLDNKDGLYDESLNAELQEVAIETGNNYIDRINDYSSQIILYSAVFDNNAYSCTLRRGDIAETIFNPEESVSMIGLYNSCLVEDNIGVAYFTYLVSAYTEILVYDTGGSI